MENALYVITMNENDINGYKVIELEDEVEQNKDNENELN